MHTSPDMSRWRGRVDAEEGALGLRWHQLVSALSGETEAGTALIGFACDAGVARNEGRVGAREGPTALRAMLANLPACEGDRICDAGDILCTGDELEAAQEELSMTLAALLDRGMFPIVLGGGHEMAFGSYIGLARHLEASGIQSPRIGVINIDAHLDLRLADRASSGTPFRQIAEDCEKNGRPFRYCCLGVSEFANTLALFERARQLGVTWLRDDDMPELSLPATLATLDGFLAGVDHVYLTICLDVLPASVAPGVSAPSARGVPLPVIEAIIDHVCNSGKLRLADIAELNPRLDIDHRTARTAARLVGRITRQRRNGG